MALKNHRLKLLYREQSHPTRKYEQSVRVKSLGDSGNYLDLQGSDLRDLRRNGGWDFLRSRAPFWFFEAVLASKLASEAKSDFTKSFVMAKKPFLQLSTLFNLKVKKVDIIFHEFRQCGVSSCQFAGGHFEGGG